MNNSEIFLLIYTLVCMGFGVFWNKSLNLVFKRMEVNRQRKIYPSVDKITEDDYCKGGHTWNKIKLAIHPLPTEVYTVCTDCGFISGTKFKLNSPGLEVFKNRIKLRDERKARFDQAFKDKQIMTTIIMNKMIQSHVGSLSGMMHKDIEVLQQFFRKSVIEIDSLYATLNKEMEDNQDG